MNKQGVVGEQALYRKVTGILDAARSRVGRTVNAEMVVAYWRIGREVVEVEQRGTKRADYGDRVLERSKIVADVWGYDSDVGENTLEAFVRLLRQKIEIEDAPKLIRTVRGVGYMLSAEMA